MRISDWSSDVCSSDLRRAKGAYAVIAQIASYGIVAFRDPYGIRPLCLGSMETDQGVEWMVASESVALTGCGYTLVRDVEPGEAIFIEMDGKLSSRQCADHPSLTPCVFEYVYFARPDSVMDGVSIYDRSEEHTSELQYLMRISYAVLCW